ncbi:MAG: hypothetical protein PW786_00695 [Arachidicoccus sp.]|nr:hypothetical protein [Arachidicoccus sp.]
MTTLLEKGFNRELGFNVANNSSLRKDAYWFGEAQSRVVVSIAVDKTNDLENELKQSNTLFTKFGTVTSSEIIVDGNSWGNIADWKNKYDTVIENIITGSVD